MMEEKIIINGFCFEITRGGVFDLEKILEMSPRILKTNEELPYKDSPRTYIGKVTGIKQSHLFKNRYYLETSGENVLLKFDRRDKENPADSRIPRVILSLPDNYFFGKEMIEQYK